MKNALLAIAIFVFYRYGGDPTMIPFIAAWASVTYTFTPSTTIKSSEVNQNFTDLINAIDKAMPSSASGHGIIMWSGSIANIPTGWYLCDGSNGTPDLRGKFVLGAGGAYSVNATGGEETHVLTESEMPSHTHVQDPHTHFAYNYSSGNSVVRADGSGSSPANGGNIGSTTATNQSTGGSAITICHRIRH